MLLHESTEARIFAEEVGEYESIEAALDDLGRDIYGVAHEEASLTQTWFAQSRPSTHDLTANEWRTRHGDPDLVSQDAVVTACTWPHSKGWGPPPPPSSSM